MSEHNLKCPYCHEEIKSNLKFCTHCGRSLVTEDSNSEVENSINSSSSEARETRSLEKPELKSSSNKKKKILWSMGAIACTILLIAGITFSFSRKPNGDKEALRLIQNQATRLSLVYEESDYQETKQFNSTFIDFYSSHSFSEDIKEYIDKYAEGCERQNHSSANLKSYKTKPSWIKGEQMKLESILNLSSIKDIFLNGQEINDALRSYFYCQYLQYIENDKGTLIEVVNKDKLVFNFSNQTGYDIKELSFIFRINNEREQLENFFDFKNDTKKIFEYYLPSALAITPYEEISADKCYFSIKNIEIEEE